MILDSQDDRSSGRVSDVPETRHYAKYGNQSVIFNRTFFKQYFDASVFPQDFFLHRLSTLSVKVAMNRITLSLDSTVDTVAFSHPNAAGFHVSSTECSKDNSLFFGRQQC